MHDIKDSAAPFEALDRLHKTTVIDQHADYHRQLVEGRLSDDLWARLDLFFRKFLAEQDIGSVWTDMKGGLDPAFVDYVHGCLAASATGTTASSPSSSF
ncbi:MAG: hypothetical protein ACFB6R_10230 [Alphaproteobacteria bacterium]